MGRGRKRRQRRPLKAQQQPILPQAVEESENRAPTTKHAEPSMTTADFQATSQVPAKIVPVSQVAADTVAQERQDKHPERNPVSIIRERLAAPSPKRKRMKQTARKNMRRPIERTMQIASGWNHVFTDEVVGDISETGIFVETDRLLCKQDPVIVKILMMNGRWVELYGRVRWANPAIGSSKGTSGMGIEFVSLTADKIKSLETMCRLAA
jgi:hypothetical protein